MMMSQLDLKTRSRIYTLTKKILRKYQKGIISGKLTSQKFVDNMLCDHSIIELLNDELVHENDFRESYKSYVEKLIDAQNETLRNCKRIGNRQSPNRADLSLKIELNRMLEQTDYKLSIPVQYLTNSDIESIIHFIETGEIELGDEKIYNYVYK